MNPWFKENAGTARRVVRVLNEKGVETIRLNAEQPIYFTYGITIRSIKFIYETVMGKGELSTTEVHLRIRAE
jgi:hypothetical protein